MKKLILLLFIVLGIINSTQAQVKSLKPIASDCKNAIRINFDQFTSYGPTVAPEGFGKLEEIKGSNDKSCFSFEKEHNTAWYCFDIKNDGDLVLDILPIDTLNDYDFMLFKYTDTSFFSMLVKQKVKPVRSNISRSGKTGVGVTGLKSSGKANFVHAGPGETFSKSLEVKKGERYYLVLDNVYPKGSGHTVKLGFEKNIQISGVVSNDEGKPVQADVILSDTHGHEAKTQSDSLGKYSINANLWGSFNYSINFLNDDYFVKSKIISDSSLIESNYKINDIKTVLPLLKGGKKYVLTGINFYGESSELLPESYASVYSLCKLMKKNKKMKIRIEGHVNHPGHPSLAYKIELSESRAHAVYNILLSNGISKDRMKTIGFGSQYMLFPDFNSTEEQQKENRRVEINVISLD